MTYLLIMPIVYIILACVFITASYLSHISMVKDKDVPFGYGTFKDFMREYNAYKGWSRDYNFRSSHFSEGDRNNDKWYIHANIILFDGKGMILYPWSYIAFMYWLSKNKLNRKFNKVNW